MIGQTQGVLYTPYIKENPKAFLYSKNSQRGFRINWSIEKNEEEKKALLSWSITTTCAGASTDSADFYALSLVIDNQEVYSSEHVSAAPGVVIAESGDSPLEVPYSEIGTKQMRVGFYAYVWKNDSEDHRVDIGETVVLSPIPVYTLSIDSDEYTSIGVQRTSASSEGSVLLKDGDKLYHSDNLLITFTPQTNYYIESSKVNGRNFSSGGTYYGVFGDMIVSASSLPKLSEVSVPTITIGRSVDIEVLSYDDRCVHNLSYKFMGLTGVIAEQTSAQNILWRAPAAFSNEIPTSLQEEGVITCETYLDGVLLGKKDKAVLFQVDISRAKPSVSYVQVRDTNESLYELTNTLAPAIRYVSSARCVARVAGSLGASITGVSVNGTAMNETQIVIDTGETVTGYMVTIDRVTTPTFEFTVTDSRGLSHTEIVNIEDAFVKYIPLTCNPTIRRDPLNGGSMLMDITGNLYRGSFGNLSNSLILKYRYRDEDGVLSEYKEVSPDLISLGNASYSVEGMSLGDDFAQDKRYDFEIVAIDGAETADEENPFFQISSIEKEIPIARFIPAFDWGKDDFNFNVPVTIKRNRVPSVVEEGSSGIWRYRKWDCGLSECWGTYVYETVVNGTWGSLYTGSTQMERVPYPEGLFIERPVETVSLCADNYTGWIFPANGGDGINTDTASAVYNVCRPTNAGTDTHKFYINFYVKGRCKE